MPTNSTIRITSSVPTGFSIIESMKRNDSFGPGISQAESLARTSQRKLSPRSIAEEREEDRQLQQQRHAGGERIDLVLLVELHHLLLLALAIVLVLRLNRLQLWLQLLKGPHRADLSQRQRHDCHPHREGQGDDRGAPAEPDRVVKEDDDRLGDVGEDGGEGERHWFLSGSVWALSGGPGRKSLRLSSGSRPPELIGLQRRTLQTATMVPRNGPSSRTACSAYWEQVG